MYARNLLTALVALALLACGGGGGGGSTTDEATFRVASSDPTDGQQAVSVTADVLVTFTEDVDPTSVLTNSLRVGSVGGQGEIPGTTVLQSGDVRTLRWTPTQSMVPVEGHVCEISAGLRSTSSERIGGTRTIAFRTAGEEPLPDLPTQDDLNLVGTLNIGRRSHTATLLQNGRVLVAGGYKQGEDITDRAELFLGQFFSFVPTAMMEERAGHTATLLADGTVLLTGGWYEISAGQPATTDGAELYIPSTNTFRAVGAMSSQRVDHAATLLPDGRVLVTGGSRLVGAFLEDLDTAEIYDPVTEMFSALPTTMAHSHATHLALDQGNGKILIYGGSDVDLRPEWYDVVDETFEALAPAPSDNVRWGAAGDTFDSGGGSIAGGDDLGTVIYVHASSGVALNTGSGLTLRRWYATGTRITPDRILVVGGIDYLGGNFMHPTCDLIIEGGVGGSRTYETEMRFPTGMVDHTATDLGDGRVLFCGGLNATGGEPELDGAYIYDPD